MEQEWKTWGMMSSYDKYMLFVSVFSKTFLILQILAMIKNMSSEDVSFTSYILYFVASVSWLVFGMIYKQTIITLSAFLGIIGGLIAMDLVIIYKNDKSNIL